MTKPHYTRAVDALWMHDTWQINFQYYSTVWERYHPLSCDRLCLMVKDSRTEPVYIHPDSLDFFKPREGDLWLSYDDETYYVDPERGLCSMQDDEPLIPELYKFAKLIMRGEGKPIIWPEGIN